MRPVLNKSQSTARWLVLALGCVCLIANYYCCATPKIQPTSPRFGTAANRLFKCFLLRFR